MRSVYEDALSRLERASKIAGISDEVKEQLSEPLAALLVSVRLRMDDGLHPLNPGRTDATVGNP